MMRALAIFMAAMLLFTPGQPTSWAVPEGYEGLVGESVGYINGEESIIKERPGLKRITLPASMDEETFFRFMAELRTLYSEVFYNQSVYFEESDDPIPDYYAPGYALTHIDISPEHKTLCSIDGVVFSKDKKTLIACPPARAGSYAAPEGVEVIGKDAFAYCDVLYKVSLPKTLRAIEDRAFYGCGGLVSVTIPPWVESIGRYAFYNCIGLKSLTLPDSASVGEGALHYLFSLNSLFVGEQVTMGEEALNHTHPNAVVYCPEGSDASQAAAVAQLKQAPIGGTPALQKSPYVLFDNPAVVVEGNGDLGWLDTVNVLSMDGETARVWFCGEEMDIPLENLSLCDPYRGYERVLEMRIYDGVKLYTKPSLDAPLAQMVKGYAFSVLQRFGTWYVVDYEGQILYAPVDSGYAAANCVTKDLCVLTEPLELLDEDGSILATFYPGEQLIYDRQQPRRVRIGGMEGFAEEVGCESVGEVHFYPGF